MAEAEADIEKIFESDEATGRAVAVDAMDAWNPNLEPWWQFREAALQVAKRVINRSKLGLEHRQLMVKAFIVELDRLKSEFDRKHPPRNIWQRLLNR